MTQLQAIRSALAASAGFPDAEDRFVRTLARYGYEVTASATILPFAPPSRSAMLTTGAGRPITPFDGGTAA